MLRHLLSADRPEKPKRPPNRDIVFEILKMGADGRWQIDTVLQDEEAAVAHADALLDDAEIARVQVIRERSSRHGPRLSAVVHEREQSRRPVKPPIALAAPAADVAWCAEPMDLFGDDSRRAIGRLLRNFLDKHQATPGELLFDYRLYRRLDTEGSLGPAALQRMAKLQAERHGLEVAARVRALEQMVSAAVRRAREHGAERRRPRLRDGDLAQLRRDAARFAPEPADCLYAVQAAVAESLRQVPSLGGKLEFVLAIEAEAAADAALLDSAIADCLGSAQTIQDLLGRQDDLYGALTTLAQLATAQFEAPADAPAALRAVGERIARFGMPATRAVLLDRTVRELGGDRPLSRHEPLEQRKQLKAIAALLATPEGRLAGGAATATALGRRARKMGVRHGFVDLPETEGGPIALLQRVLAAEAKHRAEDAKMTLGAYALDALDRLQRLPDGGAETIERVLSSGLPAPVRDAAAARLAALRAAEPPVS